MYCAVTISACVLGLVGSPMEQGPSGPRMAVADLVCEGLAANDASHLTDQLVLELSTRNVFDVMPRQTRDSILAAGHVSRRGVCIQTACLVDMGKALDVDKVIGGSVNQSREGWIVSIRMVDVGTGIVDAVWLKEHRGDEGSLLVLMKTLSGLVAGKITEEKTRDSLRATELTKARELEKAGGEEKSKGEHVDKRVSCSYPAFMPKNLRLSFDVHDNEREYRYPGNADIDVMFGSTGGPFGINIGCCTDHFFFINPKEYWIGGYLKWRRTGFLRAAYKKDGSYQPVDGYILQAVAAKKNLGLDIYYENKTRGDQGSDIAEESFNVKSFVNLDNRLILKLGYAFYECEHVLRGYVAIGDSILFTAQSCNGVEDNGIIVEYEAWPWKHCALHARFDVGLRSSDFIYTSSTGYFDQISSSARYTKYKIGLIINI